MVTAKTQKIPAFGNENFTILCHVSYKKKCVYVCVGGGGGEGVLCYATMITTYQRKRQVFQCKNYFYASLHKVYRPDQLLQGNLLLLFERGHTYKGL